MIHNASIKLNLGNPKNGWVPVQLESEDFNLEFNASIVPDNPVNKLCETLILVLNDLEAEMSWNIEPESYTFKLIPKEKEVCFSILEHSASAKDPHLIYELNGNLESIALPIYRSLKKFNTLELDKTDWIKIDQERLNKLTQLVRSKKTYKR